MKQQWYDGSYEEVRRAKERECEGFEAADGFQGERPGFVFKHGGAGLEYYRVLRYETQTDE